MTGRPSDEADFLADDAPTLPAAGAAGLPPWYVLIVDDDESVHSISRVVLGDLRFRGRPVELVSAYSRRAASLLLQGRSDIAVVLLDVVMEEDDAGLRLVREIREEMGNQSLRIILRTGQPGQAPERQVILDYDINDYKSKTELTAQKLLTATIAGLRGYADITALEHSRRGLERIIAGAPELLFAQHSLASFTDILLQQFRLLLCTDGDGLVVAPREGGEGPQDLLVVAACGSYSSLVGQPCFDALTPDLAARIAAAIASGRSETTGDTILRPVHSRMQRSGAVLFRPLVMPTADNLSLADILCAAIGVGLDNVYLHAQLLEHQAALEARVVARTRELAAVNRDLLATQTQLQEEMRVAGTLQQSILPAGFPPHPNYTGVAVMRAARSIGGDFYDIFRLDARQLGIVIADVSGKGVPAALFMVLVRTILEEIARPGMAAAAVIAETNRLLLERNPLSLFVTVIYAVLDTVTGELTFCSGGHGMPHLRHADGTVRRVAGHQSPLVGLLPDARYVETKVTLRSGDALVLTTDGVEEACNAQDAMFGEAALCRALAADCDGAAATLLAKVIAAVDCFTDGTTPSDDLTCVVISWNNPPATAAG